MRKNEYRRREEGGGGMPRSISNLPIARIGAILLLPLLFFSCTFGSTGTKMEDDWFTLLGALNLLQSLPSTIHIDTYFVDGESSSDISKFLVNSGGSDYYVQLASGSDLLLQEMDLWMVGADEGTIPSIYSAGGVHILHGTVTLPTVSDPESVYSSPFITGKGALFSDYHTFTSYEEGVPVHGGQRYVLNDLPRGEVIGLIYHIEDLALKGELYDSSSVLINTFEVHTGLFDLTLVPECSRFVDAGGTLTIRPRFNYRELFVDIGSSQIAKSISDLGPGSHVIDPYVNSSILDMIMANAVRTDTLKELGCVSITL